MAVFCRETKYYLEDGCAATCSILLAAWAHGLGSCWIAGDKKAYAGKIRELLGVAENHKLVSLISIGYSAEHPRVEKRPLAEFLRGGAV
jgi:nitroreductase